MSHADAAIEIEFDSRGLVPVIAQDAKTDQVLMFAYASAEAIARTLETDLAHYYSRSREELWQKGETSGHVQRVDEIRIDCDGDSVLYRVSQEGGACHTGYETCFYRAVEGVSADDTDNSAASEDTPTAEKSENATGNDTDAGSEGSIALDENSNRTTNMTVETRVVADRVFDPDAVY